MELRTRFDIGQKVYVLGQPAGGCGCEDCHEEGGLPGADWNILGAREPRTGEFLPLTIQAIFVIASDDPDDPQGVTVLYGMAETPGECHPESCCLPDIHQAMEAARIMNGHVIDPAQARQ